LKHLIQWTTLALALSGGLLTPWAFAGNNLLTWVHILLGFFYSVLFLLFCYDHVTHHQDRLKQKDRQTFTGTLQILLGTALLGTGFVLYLFGSQRLSPWSEIHLAATLAFGMSLGLHFGEKKHD